MKFRMIKVTTASGYTEYQIQRKRFWWWNHVYGHWDEQKVLLTLQKLRSGTPETQTSVVNT